MTFRTVTSDELEAIAFEFGVDIHLGAHEADCQVGNTLYIAHLAPLGGAA